MLVSFNCTDKKCWTNSLNTDIYNQSSFLSFLITWNILIQGSISVLSLFHRWQIHLSISQLGVSLSVDCQRVGERPARPLGNVPTDGFEMLGKLVKTRGPNSGSAPVLFYFIFYLISFQAQSINKWNTVDISKPLWSLPVSLTLEPVFFIVSSSSCSPLRSSVTTHGL